MPPKFFITRQIPSIGIQRLKSAGEVFINPLDRELTAAELITMGRDSDGWLTMLTDPITSEVLQSCPKLRAVSNLAVGFNNIDVAACTARKVGVSNTPGVLTDATAELTFALLMAVARRIVEADKFVRSGKWTSWGPMLFSGVAVTGKTLGIIGAGRIGSRVAEFGRGFRMNILYFSRNPNPDLERSCSAKRVELNELLTRSDFVSLHTPLTDQTRHIIGAAQLALMQSHAILINTSRGPLIDEAALFAALKEKRIRAAGLDVYEFEPRITPGLTDLDNVVVLPHIGSATEETRNRMAAMAADDLIAMVAGQRPQNPVNPGLW
ncbi:MAG TPA: D-glycerate dehydrogenase [Phycisphaerae bacterium]|nr:D-glycerate dehydrogenase [Phycisphaerae bacterium]